MYRDKERYGQDPTKVVRSSTTFRAPLKTGKHHWPDGSRVFTCSWSDWFIAEADAWRPEAWDVIKARPGLTFQILTKRPERIRDHLPPDWGEGYPNVWFGVSVENQLAAERADILKFLPAAVRFLSLEPLIGPVEFESLVGIHWAIIGGESGKKRDGTTLLTDAHGSHARPMDIDWVDDLLTLCRRDGVAVFVKQLGTNPVVSERLRHSGKKGPVRDVVPVMGSRYAGWDHGGDPDGPRWLRVRDFPRVGQ
jgi:protein gp37